MDRSVRRDEAAELVTTEGYPIYLHNVGGKEPDGKPTRLGKWTFATKMVREVVLDAVDGRVLNACAGETKLDKRGCEFVRNDVDESVNADLHVDVREIHQHFEPETFDAAILDPPFDPGRAAKLYEGWHGQEYANARDAVGELVRPGGTVVELGWNSWSLSDKDGWEPIEHHLFRQSSFKGDVHLTVDWKVNQTTLVQRDDARKTRYGDTGADHDDDLRTDGGQTVRRRPDDDVDPREETLDYLRDLVEPGDSNIVLARHVATARPVSSHKAGRVLARLAGQTDGIGPGDGDQPDDLEVERAWQGSNAVRWRVNREER